ncbi:MAG: MFS transporter [Candidatus Eisenbacteria bacterium]|uniref:MFS transporter n=1 Tax=Eiseniibacteriota bacterium TaxID=2212470 RepID=A0A538TEA9_UNCEI|nr:MAG: MFS transporter [Candidatus Eisenbacteria bacterium]
MTRDRSLLYAAALARSTGVGMSGVLVGLYASELGQSAEGVGLVISAGLLGVALGTLVVMLYAERLGRTRCLIGLAILSALGTAAFALAPSPWILAPAAALGMVNGMGRDRGAAFSLEQALLPDLTDERGRTQAFAWYNVVLDFGHALGALAALLPILLRHAGVAPIASYRGSFLTVAALSLLGAAAYTGLSANVRTRHARTEAPPISPESKRRIARLVGLFAMDSLGGGFLTTALLSYWFFKRFGVGEETLAPLFLLARVANAASHLAAAWLARKIGLLRTMVFTHLPSSLLLLTVPIAPSFIVAAVLYLLRECLVEMDVPTRQSYVVAVVKPPERAAAAGATNLVRTAGWAVAPAFAGAAMQGVALWAPLAAGAALKIAYDLLLYRAFRRIKPPEEQAETRT